MKETDVPLEDLPPNCFLCMTNQAEVINVYECFPNTF